MISNLSNEHSKPSMLNKLNHNLIRIICSFLNESSLVVFGQTCKELYQITSDNLFWKNIYYNKHNQFLFFNSNEQCFLLPSPRSIPNLTFFKTQFISLNKLTHSWKHSRPVITTISTNSCITCLHLINDELIYSDTDGSAGLFKIYPIQNVNQDEIYMQHHKQIKICDKLSSFYGHGGPIWGIDRHGDTLFTGSYDKTIKLWEIKNGQCLHTIRAHSSWVSSLKYNEQYDKLISGSWDTTVKIWNLQTYHPDLVINNENDTFIYCIAENISNNIIYGGTEKNTIIIWDTEKQGEIKDILVGHTHRVNCLQYKSNMLFSGSDDKTGKIWDLMTNECISELKGHSKGITNISYDDFSNRIYTSSHDTTIKIWDIRKMDKEIRTLIGHSEGVCSIAFDQSKLISGSKDNSIRIWNFSH